MFEQFWKKRALTKMIEASRISARSALTVESLEERTTPSAGIYAVGSGPGSLASVTVYDASTNAAKFILAPYPGFTGGVNVAVGDVTGNGVPDVVVAPGSGGGPVVEVFNGLTGQLLGSFFAYDSSFRQGFSIAVGDVSGSGKADIITAPNAGGGPQVNVFSGVTGTLVRSFFAYDPNFRGGMNLAAGDVNGDGVAEIITAPGSTGGPQVQVYDGANGNLLQSFFAYDSSFRNGVFVAAGDLKGKGQDQIVTAPGIGGGPQVETFDYGSLTPAQSFFAYSTSLRSGVALATYDVNQDGQVDIVTDPVGGAGAVQAFNGSTLATIPTTLSGLPAGTAYNTTKPAVALTTTSASTTSSMLIPFTATFSEGVNGLSATKIQVTNGTVSNFVATSATTYTFDIAPVASGGVTVVIPAGVVTDSALNANTASNSVSITYTPVPRGTPPSSFSADSPPNAIVGSNYSYTFVANGSPAPTYTLTTGSLPTGLSLNSVGLLSGTTTTSGTFNFQVAATNSVGALTTGTLTVKVTPVDPSRSSVSSTADGSNLTSGGNSTVTVTAKDAAGDPVSGLTASDITLGLTAASVGNGTFSNFQALGAGQYSELFTATTAGSVTFSASIDSSSAINDSQSVTIVPGPISQSTSSITSPTDGGTLASGTTTTVTFTAKDAAGNPLSNLTSANIVFGLTSGSVGTGSFTNFQNLGNGRYSETYSADLVGSITFMATVSPVTIVDSHSVTITAGALSPANSSLTSPVDGSSLTSGNSTVVTLLAKDAAGNAITGMSAGNITFALTAASSAAGSYSNFQSLGSGVYSETFTATAAGTATFTATIASVTIQDSQSVAVNAIDGNNSSITSPNDGGILANSGTATVSFTAKDGAGALVNNLTASQISFGVAGTSTGGGTFNSASFVNLGNGHYSESFTATAVGSVTFEATVGAVTVTDSQSVSITTTSGSNSSVTSPADGGSLGNNGSISVTYFAKDGAGNPVTNLTSSDISFGLTSSSTGSGTFNTLSFTNLNNGQYTETFTASSPGVITFKATVGTIAVVDTHAVTITAISLSNSSISSPDDNGKLPHAGSVTVTFTARDGANNPVTGLTSSQIAFGIAASSTGAGTFNQASFQNPSAGVYTEVFTATTVGSVVFNATVSPVTVVDSGTVTITTIDPTHSSISSPSDGGTVPHASNITVTFTARDGANNPVTGLTSSGITFGVSTASTGSGTFDTTTFSNLGNGQYSEVFKANGAGSVSFTATVGPELVVDTNSVTITAIDGPNSSISSPDDGGNLAIGGTVTVTFTAKDGANNPVTGLTSSDIAFGVSSSSTGSGTFNTSTFANLGNGRYSEIFAATGIGSIFFQATVGPTAVVDSGFVEIYSIDSTFSTVTSVDDNGLLANEGTVTVVFTARDGANNPVNGLTSSEISFGVDASSTGGGSFTLASFQAHGNGVYSEVFTATTVGPLIFSATVLPVTVNDSSMVTITAVAAANSSIASPDDGSTLANGGTVTVTFTAKNGANNPVNGLTSTDIVFGLTGGSTGHGSFNSATFTALGGGLYSEVFTASATGTITFEGTVGPVTVVDGSSVTII